MKNNIISIVLTALMVATPVLVNTEPAYAGPDAPAAVAGVAAARAQANTAYAAGNLEEAFRWLKLAAEQGDSYAQNRIGMMLIEGTGTPKDDVEGKQWLQQAANQGNEDAIDNLKWLDEQEKKKEEEAKQTMMGTALAVIIFGLVAAAATSSKPNDSVEQDMPDDAASVPRAPRRDNSDMGCAWGNRTDGTCH